ncbi:MAG: hypothetical protein RML10_09465 [Geminocystis sp.]|nr:hypothetical protein [Geminocystis sp.]
MDFQMPPRGILRGYCEDIVIVLIGLKHIFGVWGLPVLCYGCSKLVGWTDEEKVHYNPTAGRWDWTRNHGRGSGGVEGSGKQVRFGV